MKAELIVALDAPDTDTAMAVVDQLPDKVSFYKVGLELFGAEGPRVVQALRERGKRVFLDLKLHDIPRTVARAVSALSYLGADLLTIHAAGGAAMIRAASENTGDTTRVIAVTTLTSLDQQDLNDIGVLRALPDQALALANLALSNGAHGLVTSVHEAASLRTHFGAGPLLVTPGIRPAGGTVGDQKRVATPADAVAAGASHLVVGRPILEAANPATAAERILHDMLPA